MLPLSPEPSARDCPPSRRVAGPVGFGQESGHLSNSARDVRLRLRSAPARQKTPAPLCRRRPGRSRRDSGDQICLNKTRRAFRDLAVARRVHYLKSTAPPDRNGVKSTTVGRKGGPLNWVLLRRRVRNSAGVSPARRMLRLERGVLTSRGRHDSSSDHILESGADPLPFRAPLGPVAPGRVDSSP